MEKIAILVDSGSDIDTKLADEYGIYMIPFYVNLDGHFYKEQEELKTEDFYDWIVKHETLPKTSIPSPGELLEKYEQIKNDGYEKVIVITISQHLSSFYNLCMQLDYDGLEIAVIDSQSVALTIGLLAIYAKNLVDEGLSFEEVVAKIEAKKSEAWIYFTIDTFKYIISGGRVPKVFGKVGDLLSIKPIVTCSPEDGRFHIVKTVRGEKKVVREFYKLAKEKLDGLDDYYMLISNGGYKKGQKILEDKLKEFMDQSKLFLTSSIAPTLGANTGPGLFGFGYLPLD